jgi:hypothetical protein
MAGCLRLAGPRPGPQTDRGRFPRSAAGGHPVCGSRGPHAHQQRQVHAGARAVEDGERLDEVPVWLADCESYAASNGYRHELAHIHLVRAVYDRRQGRPDAARELLDGALTVLRQAGDFRCVTRTLLELAGHHRPGDPAAAADLLRQGLQMAMLAGGESLCAKVLASGTGPPVRDPPYPAN